VMEARLEGRQPVAVAHQATTVEQAVEGAVHKLARLIESTLGRLHDQASAGPIPLCLNRKIQTRHERYQDGRSAVCLKVQLTAVPAPRV
jgi:hypothetical protein